MKLGYGNDNFSEDGISVTFTCLGIYLDGDFLIKGNHSNSTEVKVWQNEKSGWAGHLGYQIPIVKWLKIIPNIGFINCTYGSTNGYNWKVTQNGISNKFTSYGDDYKTKEFDYGAVIVLHPCKYLNINLHANRHTLGVSVAFDLVYNGSYYE